MDDATTLLEIEAIKQLKARYCRHLDTKDWQAWRSLFSDDFVSDTSTAGGKVINGADEFVAFTRKGLRSKPPCTRYTRRKSSSPPRRPPAASGHWKMWSASGPG